MVPLPWKRCYTNKFKFIIITFVFFMVFLGYDDENGSYLKVIHDHLAYRYEVLEVLGKGSFGQVVKCIDHKTGQFIAVKIIRNKKRYYSTEQNQTRICITVSRTVTRETVPTHKNLVVVFKTVANI